MTGTFAGVPGVAHAICFPSNPEYDPRTCEATNLSVESSAAGAKARFNVTVHKDFLTIGAGSYVEDTADDDKAAHAWIQYGIPTPDGTFDGETVLLGTASGMGRFSHLSWAVNRKEFPVVRARVCNGEGESTCDAWRKL